ncbi:hypothetical protein Tco_1543394, partial [Tanacetum coccineum]
MLTITLIGSSASLAYLIFQGFLKTQSCFEFFPLLLPERQRDGWTDSPQELLIPRISSKKPLSKGIALYPRPRSSLKIFTTSSKKGPIPGMTPTQAFTAIQTMVDHSQKWHDETTSRNVESNSSSDGLAALVNTLDTLSRDMKKLKEIVHAIQ